MKTLETIYKKLNSVEKTELETHKVELGIVQDFIQEYKKAQTKFDDGVSSIDRASELAEKAKKSYLEIEKISKELGAPVDKKIKKLSNNLEFYINAIKKLK